MGATARVTEQASAFIPKGVYDEHSARTPTVLIGFFVEIGARPPPAAVSPKLHDQRRHGFIARPLNGVVREEADRTKGGRTMRTISKAVLAGGMALLLGAGLAGTAVAAQTTLSTGTATVAMAADESRDADLAFTRDEERMARDLYTLFAQTYEAQVFDRIAASEQQHFDAVGTLLSTYGVADPAAGQPAGTYANAEVQALYDQWKAEGLESQDAALAVGVALEQADIADLEDMVARATDADVQRVFTHLLAASRHHLVAFTNNSDGTVCAGNGDGMGAMNGPRGDGRGQRMGADGFGMGRSDS